MTGDNGIGEPIERKYHVTAQSTQTGLVHDENHAMVFLARDPALPATLGFYLDRCREMGAAPEQIKAVELLVQRVTRYQEVNGSEWEGMQTCPRCAYEWFENGSAP